MAGVICRSRRASRGASVRLLNGCCDGRGAHCARATRADGPWGRQTSAATQGSQSILAVTDEAKREGLAADCPRDRGHGSDVRYHRLQQK